MELSYPQRLAARQLDKVTIISAGAGSGKTRTLVGKFKYLIEKGYNPERILAITFTNKAANELKSRLVELTDRPYHAFPWVRTIHSACLQMLKPFVEHIGYKTPVTIYSPAEQRQIVRRVLKAFNLNPRESTMITLKIFSQCKNNEKPKEYISQYVQDNDTHPDIVPIKDHVVDMFDLYEEMLASNNAIDFNDILWYTYDLLSNNDGFKKEYQKLFQYIMVDEYQDVNFIQNEIIKSLVTNNNLTIVGDDFQCWHKDGIVKTSNGNKSISELNVGDLVSTIYKQEIIVDEVTAIQKQNLPTLKITTHTGKNLTISYQHKCFASKPSFKSGGYYLYLMYRHDKGFRIGYLTGGLSGTISSRSNPERPDRLWFIKRYESKREVRYNEIQLSTKYCVLTLPFFHNGNQLTTTQEDLDLLFEEFGENGWDLLEDFGLEFDYPNYVPQGTTRHDQKHININLMINETRGNSVSYWSEGERDGGLRANYKDARLFAEQLYNKYEADIIVERFHYDNQTRLDVIPARQLTIDMDVPVMLYNSETDSYYYSLETIASIEHYEDTSEVYHIEMARTGNLIVNDIVSHNSIYKWRGSDPEFFINYDEHFESCELFRLEQNYRSANNIVELSNALIAKNKNQIYKKCFSTIVSDARPTIIKFEDDEDESKSIALGILEYAQMGISINDIAVLYRAKHNSRSIEQALAEYSIPYTIVGSVSFFERREVKDLLSYLNFMNNPNDEITFERCLTTPRRGIGGKTIEKIKAESGENLLFKCANFIRSGKIRGKGQAKLDQFITLIHKASQKSPHEAVNDIIEYTDYYTYMKGYSIDEEDVEDRTENIRELTSLASKSVDLEEFIEECSLLNAKDSEETDNVKLMTIHAAKGLEFKAIFIIGLEDGLFPHHRALAADRKDETTENVEEERRLFYVAVTRAETLLNMTHCEQRSCSFAKYPSRFIREISRFCTFVDTTEHQRN